MMEQPLVSIILATYNCSHILRYAIDSVRGNAFQDWELVIVGDHCTDDSAECVAAYNDPRLQFYNLAQNSGQQATPNNFGLTKVRGDYLAYLNHDDLYMPWHLERMLASSQAHPDSIILTGLVNIVVNDGEETGDNLTYREGGATARRPHFTPSRWHVASGWFMPTALARRAGPWQMECETVVTPSQDWLFRAWRSGIPVHCETDVSIITIATGKRANFYRKRRDAEHRYVYEQFVISSRRHQELLDRARQKSVDEEQYWRRRLRRLYEHIVGRALSALGIHPNTLELRLRYGGPGAMIRQWQRRTGNSV
ncbi:glycosyltransferase family 2 protein [Candidatus Marimicrobium litorale]|uniref:Glycosyltransferase family 2 protein n=1 Tax=Candidatus Marimicrobium litorale TaxID=2518991 RepID=A0ABT3T9E7_9GAMM|nr:glycosyltransferase family 2 protein [Candidatus Marimicrobium litorale]MCX2978913.1 glycosyltransferase family 2 protein [Candidatus Marimicrobium litorale]